VELIAAIPATRVLSNGDTSKPNGQPRRCLDTSRAKKFFGFEAQMTFDEGLKRTIDWYQENKGRIK
jgi:GDP-L-fucose synthase